MRGMQYARAVCPTFARSLTDEDEKMPLRHELEKKMKISCRKVRQVDVDILCVLFLGR